MSLNARKIPSTGGGGKKFDAPVLEPGGYPARLVQILAMGLQPQRPYKGEEKPPQYELMVTYELLDEFLEDDEGNPIEDKPRWISETFPMYSLEADLAKSTKRYCALDPQLEFDGDWAQLIGAPCVVNLVQNKSVTNGKTYNNVSAVSTMRAKEAKVAPSLVNPPKVFDISEPDAEVFWSLPDWIKDKMKANLEYAGSALEALVEAGPVSSKDTPKKAKKAVQTPSQDVSEGDEEEDDTPW